MPTLLEQGAYKKKVRVGDVFSMKFPEGYVFGQVVAQNAPFGGFSTCQHRVAVFSGVYTDLQDWASAIRAPLLIPPYHINNLGFSRGFMVVIGHATPVEIDSIRFCYTDVRGRFFDLNNQPCEKRGMVGEYGLGNHLTLSDAVRGASNNSIKEPPRQPFFTVKPWPDSSGRRSPDRPFMHS